MAFWTVAIFSASSSGISTPNSSASVTETDEAEGKLVLEYATERAGELKDHFADGRGLGVDPIDVGVRRVRMVVVDVDLVSAGQAFHWFDRVEARREFARILKPGGWVALLWNERDTGADIRAFDLFPG